MIADSVEALISEIGDGQKIAIPTSTSGAAMAATRAIVKRGIKDLHLVAVPTSGMQADLLIGAGCVSVMESAGVTLDEQGQAPRFVSAVKQGTIRLMDTTCPALISAVQAGEKGIPFIAMRGLIGSDLLANRADYKCMDNPFSPDDQKDPIVLLPAIVPDIALFHAPLADRHGNVWIGKNRELMTMAHASKRTLVSVESIIEDNLLEDDLRAPATIPAHYVSAIAKSERGAWPLALEGCYDADASELQTYAAMAKSDEGFAAYVSENREPALQDAAE